MIKGNTVVTHVPVLKRLRPNLRRRQAFSKEYESDILRNSLLIFINLIDQLINNITRCMSLMSY